MSKQFIALKDGLVAGPCSLDQLRSELVDSQMGDEELDDVVVYELVPAYTVRALSVKLLPIRPSKPAKKGR